MTWNQKYIVLKVEVLQYKYIRYKDYARHPIPTCTQIKQLLTRMCFNYMWISFFINLILFSWNIFACINLYIMANKHNL